MASVIDAFSRKVVGWAVADHMRTDLVLDALRMATTRRRPPKDVVFHADRGSQYTSKEFVKFCKINGVRNVRDEITVLPVSQFDDELRYRIAASIYNNSNFWNYAIMANPPIHIVVEHGRVTLTGVVQNNIDRVLARSLATQFGAFSVTNALKTDAEVRDALEKTE